jgi:hypothetical protein
MRHNVYNIRSTENIDIVSAPQLTLTMTRNRLISVCRRRSKESGVSGDLEDQKHYKSKQILGLYNNSSQDARGDGNLYH